MELRQLQSLCAIVRLGSFSKAADELFITQPAISMHIKALERELGLDLFERTGRNVRLTQPGELFHEYSQRILRLVEEARHALAQMTAHS